MTVPVTVGDADQVVIGPGTLFVAAVGTAEPTTIAGVTGASAWREVGWTDDGTAFTQDTTTEGIEVEEEFFPVKYATTTIVAKVGFAMKQATRRNLALALNQGAAAANDTTQLTPATPGAEVRVSIALITPDDALFWYPRAFQTGSVNLNFQKAPDATLIPVEFSLE